MSNQAIRHAQGCIVPDASLCGVGFEEFGEDGVSDEEMGNSVAEVGQAVTCEDCLRIISYSKKFKRNVQPE